MGILAVAVGVAWIGLRGHLPGAGATWGALRGADPIWLIAAVALHGASLVAFAEQERRLLGAFGVRMPLGRAVAVTVTRSAMTMGLPGGSAVAAAYGFRQFQARGASRTVAGAVTLLCGVTSVTGLALLYAGDALFQAGPVVASGTVVAATALIVIARLLLRRRSAAGSHRRGFSAPGVFDGREPLGSRELSGGSGPFGGREPLNGPEPFGGPEFLNGREPLGGRGRFGGRGVVAARVGEVRRVVRETAVLAKGVPVGRWVGVVGIAVLNWLFDLLCLLVCLRAVGLDLAFPAVAAAFLGAQLARQIPFTAGGIGVIEAGLIVALTALGGASAAVTAAVLIYRVLTCWAMLPLGAASWAVLRHLSRFYAGAAKVADDDQGRG